MSDTEGRNEYSDDVNEPESYCRRFSLAEVLVVTMNFSDHLVIGKGGFGKVYKGFIDDGVSAVAIKRLNAESKQGAREFWTEINTLSKLRHNHLVSLIGFADEEYEMILVYEYIPKGTLADHLYRTRREEDVGDTCHLTWEQRLNICIDAACGLDYLHGKSIIHRDVKSTNILLDENWVAKIADFGLSKITHMQSHVSTDVKGTFGYLDPDYFFSHRLTTKSDVYAFGVVLLEVLCTRPPVDTSVEEVEQRSLALWAQKCFEKGRLLDMIDPFLRKRVSSNGLKMVSKIAIQCLHKDPKRRPAMAEVVRNLKLVLASESNARQHKGKVAGLSSSIARILGIDSPKKDSFPEIPSISFRRFTMAEVQAATNHFNEHQVIGRGYFAKVYRCLIDGGTREVVVKRWREGISRPQVNIIKMEIEVQSQLHHLNLVSLIGYYIDDNEAILVYDYMTNKSLRYHLYKTKSSSLSWEKRLDICLSIARALLYLRAKWPSVHRYLKLTNILLDQNWNAKLSGFEYPNLTHNESKDHESASDTGLFDACDKQYIDPEFYNTRRFSEKSDAYSFGVILLELLCGRSRINYSRTEGTSQVSIAQWFERSRKYGLEHLTIDPYVAQPIAPECFETYAEIALSCVSHEMVNRPTMEDVLISLERASQVQKTWLEQNHGARNNLLGEDRYRKTTRWECNMFCTIMNSSRSSFLS